AFELGIVELESERLDQVQRRARRRAEPGDVAGVRGDFGFNENDVHFKNSKFQTPSSKLQENTQSKISNRGSGQFLNLAFGIWNLGFGTWNFFRIKHFP